MAIFKIIDHQDSYVWGFFVVLPLNQKLSRPYDFPAQNGLLPQMALPAPLRGHVQSAMT